MGRMGITTVAPQTHCHNRSEMGITRPKKVTDPLNELVRAKLRGDCEAAISTNYGSSGSEHDPNSACLADMVYGFMEEEGRNNKLGNCLNGAGKNCSDSISEADGASDDDSATFISTELQDILEGLVACTDKKAIEALLHKEAFAAVEYKCPNNHKGSRRRSVMKHLREVGFDAGICKSRWGHTAGFPAGDYEYIDVVIDEKQRFFVDIDFGMEFEIARPTREYNGLLQILPQLFVGKAERLKSVIKIMCDSAKRSLKKKGMHLPPWRKYLYMHAKWFGPYKRTTNELPMTFVAGLNEFSVREIGWDHGFNHQMDLHYEKSMRDAFKRKDKRDAGEEIDNEWMPPAVTPRRGCRERDGRLSGLACALNEAGLA